MKNIFFRSGTMKSWISPRKNEETISHKVISLVGFLPGLLSDNSNFHLTYGSKSRKSRVNLIQERDYDTKKNDF